MPSQYVMRRRDFDGDTQQSSFNVIGTTTLSEINDLDVTFLLWLAGAQAGTFYKQESVADTGLNGPSPTDQGSLQLIVEMTDSVNGRPYNIRAPIPDVTKAADVGSNPAWISSGGLTVANPAHADYALLVSAIEAAWESPEGNTGTVARIYIEE